MRMTSMQRAKALMKEKEHADFTGIGMSPDRRVAAELAESLLKVGTFAQSVADSLDSDSGEELRDNVREMLEELEEQLGLEIE